MGEGKETAMNIATVYEGKRGCGYRKPGGLYLRTDGLGRYCGALPVEVSVCPTCNHGIKPARGWTWINLAELVAVRGCNHEGGCGDCPIADAKIQRVGLLWIGEKFYPTPRQFNNEATAMGLSRRITQIPRDFKLGETWIALAHRKAITNNDVVPVPLTVGEADTDFILTTHKPGIFHVFMPTRIEYCVKEDDSEEKLERMEKRGITLVKVVQQPEQQAA